MTQIQLLTLEEHLRSMFRRYGSSGVFIHGGCHGADVQAGEVAYGIGFSVIVRPGDRSQEERAKHEVPPRSHIIHAYDQKGYLSRNRAIVKEADVLFGAPKEFSDQPRGGTWYTLRRARAEGTPFRIFFPDGTTEDEF